MQLNFDLDEVQRLVAAHQKLNAAVTKAGVDDPDFDKLYEELDELDDQFRALTKQPVDSFAYIASSLRGIADRLDDADMELETPEGIPSLKVFLESIPDELEDIIRKARIYEEG